MDTLRTIRPILIGLAIGILLALFIAPQTRWIVRSQLGAALFHSTIWGMGDRREPWLPAAYVATDKAEPSDYQIQLAYTIWTSGERVAGVDYAQIGDPRVAALRGLIPRFGDNPSLYANILRYSAGQELEIPNSPADWAFTGQAPPASNDAEQPQADVSSEAILSAYDQDAAAGERLDPTNAYFPLMRAVGLLAAGKDDGAIAAVLRAGRETKFDDYSPDEVEGKWKLNEAMIGGQSALPRLSIEASLLFPHYAKMRQVARIATYKAMLLEQSGQTEQGLAIRNALMHIGSLMRVQSHSVIGSLVGIAITHLAMERPGGAPYIPAPPRSNGVELERERVDAFCGYLNQIGRGDETTWVRAESSAGDQAKSVVQQGTATGLFLNVAVRAMIWWAVSILVLWVVFWLIVSGIVATLVSRSALTGSGERLPAPIGRGIAAAVILVVVGLTAEMLYMGMGWWSLLALLIASPLWIVCAVRTPEWLSRLRADDPGEDLGEDPRGWPGVAAFLGTLAVLLAALGLAGWQAWELAGYIEGFDMLTTMGDAQTNGPSPAYVAVTAAVVIMAIAVSLPGAVMAIVGLVRKRPLSVALTLGYREWAVPLACLFLIAYGPMVIATLSKERAANAVLQATVQNEGTYYAHNGGGQWPGPVSEPDPALTGSNS